MKIVPLFLKASRASQGLGMIDGNNTFVWVVKKGGATKRIVKTGGVSDQGTVILDGLESGDAVIVSGQNKVSEGSKIKMV